MPPAKKSAVVTQDIKRPPKSLIKRLEGIGAATAAGELNRMGIKNVFIQGPTTWTPGRSIVGPALTLQFMPKRGDIYPEGEYVDPERQLHRHVLYHTQPGDIVVVDARAEMSSGVFGEMMLTYFKGKGGIGAVIDGCIRDWPHAKEIDLGYWLRGVTPNFHVQTTLMPFAVNGPIACGNVLVMPGDIIIADDDGAVVVPAHLASDLATKGHEHAEWEVFAKLRLSEGGDLRKYYPPNDAASKEYEAWRKAQSAGKKGPAKKK
ncbi:MAG: ribonuclease activity regulator RraA [SAR202 cluster bacterium]|nr:ribonuclease activity regulator RraA [SAR202 cluster bacterium]